MIKAPTAAMLYHIGLGLEGGTDEETMRGMWGDPVVDWLLEQEQTPEYQAFRADLNEFVKEQGQQAPNNPKWLALLKKHGG